MAVDIRARTVVRAPRSQVAEYATDPNNDLKWITGISTVRMITPRPFGEGTQVERLAGFLRRRIEYVLEVTRFEPETVLEMKSVKSPFPMEVTCSFADDDGGTAMEIRVQGGPGGVVGLFGALLGQMVKRNVSRDLANLKRILEARSA